MTGSSQISKFLTPVCNWVVLWVLYIFDFQWHSHVPLHQFLGTLCHCQLNIRDYCESLGNHEKPGLEETWARVCLVTRHIIIFLSNHAQLLKPRLDEEWVCQPLHVNNLLQNRDPRSWCCKQWPAWKRCYLVCVPVHHEQTFPSCQTTFGIWGEKFLE